MIALPGPLHESSLVHGASPFRRGRSGALGWYVGREPRFVPDEREYDPAGGRLA
jgi:hypothetical protein